MQRLGHDIKFTEPDTIMYNNFWMKMGKALTLFLIALFAYIVFSCLFVQAVGAVSIQEIKDSQNIIQEGKIGGQTLLGGQNLGSLEIYGGINSGNLYLDGTQNKSKTDSIVAIQNNSGYTVIGFSGLNYPASRPLTILSTEKIGNNYVEIHSYNNSYASGLFFYQSTSPRWLFRSMNNNDYTIYNYATGNIPFIITTNDKIGIGITPVSQFDTIGSVRFRNCSGTPTFDAGGNLTCASDEKLKKDILPYFSTNVKLPNPIKYKWNDNSGYDTTHENIGFSAQTVEQDYPECIINRKDISYQTVCNNEQEPDCNTVEVFLGTYTKSIDQTCLLAASFNKINSLEDKLNNLCNKHTGWC